VTDDTYIQWLGKTFDEFVATYGYTDKNTVRRVSEAIAIFQAARELDFEDPKAIVAHFYGKQLISDLTLRGVFGDLEECR